MADNLKKRIITSVFLLLLFFLMIFFKFILIISLMIIITICWIEFSTLISRIISNKNFKNKLLKFLCKLICFLYLFLLAFLLTSTKTSNSELDVFIVYSIAVSIMSDIGGLFFGKTFKGRKLTKISPQKTISGSIGSFVFSLCLIPFFINYLNSQSLLSIFLITLIISLSSQLGDLFISFLKRCANVKDTSDLLPGHGGVLDRLDGIIFAIPVGYLLLSYS